MKQRAPHPNQRLMQLEAAVRQLQETLRLLEERRQLAAKQRRQRLTTVGISVSVLAHIILLIFLGLYQRGAAGSGGTGAEPYHIAIINDEELTQNESESFDEISVEEVVADAPELETAPLTATQTAPAELSAAAGSVPTLGGAGTGGGGDLGLGGGGGGTTSFFGIGGKGNRFAFIIDISGSMGDRNKLEIAKREMIRAISGLPDYASFYVLLFSNDFVEPPHQKGWSKARKPLIDQCLRWLSQIGPNGGTAPRTSFMQVFSLAERPDVIYFLTDGEFTDISADEITAMNRAGKRAVIHAIQFGDRGKEDLMRAIAKASGGVYRFVPAEGG